MAKHSMHELVGNLHGLFCEKEGLKVMLEQLLNYAMEYEVDEHLGAGYHERSGDRRGHRNKFKRRRLKTVARSGLRSCP